MVATDFLAATQRLFTVRRFRRKDHVAPLFATERWIGKNVSLLQDHKTKPVATGILTGVTRTVFGYDRIYIDGWLYCRWPGDLLINNDAPRRNVSRTIRQSGA